VQIKLAVATLVLFAGEAFGALPIHNPWFDILITYVLFKIMVSGMPEPTEKSSDGYVWAYRSMHMLALIPTRYFANKSFWHIFEDEDRASPDGGGE